MYINVGYSKAIIKTVVQFKPFMFLNAFLHSFDWNLGKTNNQSSFMLCLYRPVQHLLQCCMFKVSVQSGHVANYKGVTILFYAGLEDFLNFQNRIFPEKISRTR